MNVTSLGPSGMKLLEIIEYRDTLVEGADGRVGSLVSVGRVWQQIRPNVYEP